MTDFQPIPYAPRPTRFRAVIEYRDWRLKRYDIWLAEAGEFDESVYTAGLEIALQALPTPAVSTRRPGIGFVICHQGRKVHYIVLCWWDNENELHQRVFTRGFAPADAWSDSHGQASFCVWDALLIGQERDAYVAAILSPEGPDIDAYLANAAPVRG